MKKELEAILDTLPQQPPRSRLDPYAELIDEMRRRDWTYRGIAQILAEKCNLSVSPSNIHYFVKQRQPQMANNQHAKNQQAEEIRKRIHALKRRSTERDQDPKAFEFDPAKPLRLNKPR
jgi:IS30 family transposase